MNRARLFAGAAVDTQAGALSGRAAQRHRLALLAVLCVAKGAFVKRDRIATLLWPDASADRGRRLLSDSTYRVNRALQHDIVHGTSDDLRLDAAHMDSDVAELEMAAEAGDAQRVVQLYAGPFMDGFYLPDSPAFEQWMTLERARYERVVARSMETLALAARDKGHHDEALEWWRQLAALVPDDSRVTVELMRCLDATGNRAAALRHAREHATVLRNTLGAEPDRSVTDLADALRAQPGTTDAGSAIAVLPFNTVGDAAEDAFVAEGVSEEVTSLLARTAGLRVASWTSSLAYRDLTLDVREVGRRLDVHWVLEGSVRCWGRRRRIMARLADAETGYQVWSESFDGSFDDDLGVQRDIATRIAGGIAAVCREILDRRRNPPRGGILYAP